PHLEMLADLQQKIGFEFTVISHPKPKLPIPSLRWSFIPWSPEMESRIGELIDVGIMPLVDDAFQQGKCGLKLLQYMAGGLPVIASPVGVNRNIAEGNGYLAASAPEWHQAITALNADRKLLRDFGMAGRAFCENNYDLKTWAGVLNRLLETVANPE
ncbi:MAG: glycosyltransferase, partial [Verrucomicrobiota bacterium]